MEQLAKDGASKTPGIKAVIGLKILVLRRKEETIDQTETGLFVVDNKAVRPKYGTVFMVGGKVNTELSAEGEPQIASWRPDCL
jgi:co-chaperonin GroES (HSP10)